MLGKIVSASVVEPIGVEMDDGFIQPLNYAKIDDVKNQYAYIYGEDRTVSYFDGEVVAGLMPKNKSSKLKPIWILAEEGAKPINVDILEDIDMEHFNGYTLKCKYERSCGAIVYRYINGQIRYLLIRNKRSSYWGFPKGHVEKGETRFDTARREVLEETGLKIHINLGFEGSSLYTVGNNVEKQVYIYTASTKNARTKIQKEEIEDYAWLPFVETLKKLRFQNDRRIFEKGVKYLHNNNLLEPAIEFEKEEQIRRPKAYEECKQLILERQIDGERKADKKAIADMKERQREKAIKRHRRRKHKRLKRERLAAEKELEERRERKRLERERLERERLEQEKLLLNETGENGDNNIDSNSVADENKTNTAAKENK